MSGPAADLWRSALADWAIPPEILAAAPESPWGFPVELFASRADAAVAQPTRSNLRALESLPEGGPVLDVGSGAGAASLPLAGRAGRLIAVDTSKDMLGAFASRASAAGVAFDSIQGRWPDAADGTPVADVVVCNHVFYNAPDLDEFVEALTSHARVRVVVELTPEHPTANMNALWLRFHSLTRPTRPTADDAAAVVRETLGVEPEREEWSAPSGGSLSKEAMVAWMRRRLCLPADRDPEIAEALEGQLEEVNGGVGFGDRTVVTLWWPGSAA